MMTQILRVCLCVTIVACAAGMAGVGAAGNDETRFQQVVPAARPGAMGEAYTAIAGDYGSLFFNPAGLGGARHTQLPYAYHQWVSGSRQQFLGVVFSLGAVETANVAELGTLTAGRTTFETDDAIQRDAAGVETGRFDASNDITTVAYALPLLGVPESWTLLGGIGVDFVSEKAAASKIEHTMVDAGILWESSATGLAAGVAVQNIGAADDYLNPEFIAPMTARAGLAYRFPGDSVLLSADVSAPEERDAIFCAGGEFWIVDALALRAGYDSSIKSGPGLTAGLGVSLLEVDIYFMYFREIGLSYAYAPYGGDLGDTHRVDIKFSFGAD